MSNVNNMIRVDALLSELIQLTNQASKIARFIRQDAELFSHLINDKTDSGGANPKFFRDFKSFADVLIQQMIAYRLELRFPSLSARVFGEENEFFEVDESGEKLSLRLSPDQAEFSERIKAAVSSKSVRDKLIPLLYESSSMSRQQDCSMEHIPETVEINMDLLEIWVDPIDGTNVYIRSDLIDPIEATVLIGVLYDSRPIIGVVGHIFADRIYWGVTNLDGLPRPGVNNLESAMERKEGFDVVCAKRLKLPKALSVVNARGAGYKMLQVVLGQAKTFIAEGGGIYVWDILALHAIMLSSGMIVRHLPGPGCSSDVEQQLVNADPTRIHYDEKHALRFGLIAGFAEPVEHVLSILSECGNFVI